MKTSLDLMTNEDRRRQVLLASKQFWVRMLGTSLAILVVVGGVEWWLGRATSRQLRLLEDRYAPILALRNECLRMRTDIQAMREAQQLTLRLVDTRPTTTLLGTISTAAAKTGGEIYVEQLQLDQRESSAVQRTAVVVGMGKDNAAIAQFAAALRESQLFSDVTLSSSDTTQAVDERARSFRIECQL
jgi:hypothetical protein